MVLFVCLILALVSGKIFGNRRWSTLTDRWSLLNLWWKSRREWMSWISHLISSSNSQKHGVQQQTLQIMDRNMTSFQNIVSKFSEEEIKYLCLFWFFFFKSHKPMLYLWYTNYIFIIKLALFIDFILNCNKLNQTSYPKVRCLRNIEGIYPLLVAGVHGWVSNIFKKQSSTFHLCKKINLPENFQTLF